EMVSQAGRTKAPIQKIADIVSKYFVIAVLLIALITFASWYLLGPDPKLSNAIINSIAVLIIACPCALGLATPISITIATELGAKFGVLIKNAEKLELLSKIDTLVLDKTGTITEGKPKLNLIKAITEYKEDELLLLAASIEKNSEHHLGKAFIQAANEKNLKLSKVTNFESITSKGVSGIIDGLEIKLGNEELFNNQDIPDEAEQMRADGQTVMFIGVNDKIVGFFAISDAIKPEVKIVLERLRNFNIRIIMLTGDNPVTANKIAKQIGITEVIAGVTVAQKLEIIKDLQEQGAIVAMAGDGINDSPALVQSNVGVAMGNGTDIAIESASITIINGDIQGIVRAYILSKITMRNIKQNLFLAFGYNALSIPIASGVLYNYGILLSPVIASVAMSLSSLSVIYNALRLRLFKFI
ncbi:MAG: heavy metal translocating P-type ATPase, partial [Pseudomonadota bacterium]